jgi:hypothetical protein
MAGFDKIDPGQFMSSWRYCLTVWVGRPAHLRRAGLQPHREGPARKVTEGILVTGEYALRRRSGVVSKMRVLTS